MLSSFLDSWSLFAPTYISGWAAAVLLASLGVPVVGRDQIFIGAAVTQAATLGIAVALTLGASMVSPGFAQNPVTLSVFAVTFSIAATFMTTRHAKGGQTREAVTGWVFLFSSAAMVLLLTNSPLNMADAQQLLLSNMIGARWSEAVTFTIAALAVVALAVLFSRPMSLWVMDRTMAAGVGMRVKTIELLFALLLGAALGLSLQTAGMLYTFACLVLPGLIAKQLSRRVGPMFLIAPVVALVASTIGFVVANDRNIPPGPLVVLILTLLMGPGFLYKRFVKRG